MRINFFKNSSVKQIDKRLNVYITFTPPPDFFRLGLRVIR
jgi:hypothetical protein